MKVRFVNGAVKTCTAPTEQKIFKTSGSGKEGWVLLLRLTDETTSTELDDLLQPDNVSTLEFLTELNGEEKVIFTLSGYEKVSSSIIRHADTLTATSTEIQMTKGV